jgi:uncharacterized membrane protein
MRGAPLRMPRDMRIRGPAQGLGSELEGIASHARTRMPAYHVHPAIVHFPIALLLSGLMVAIAAALRQSAGLDEAAKWILWLGTASLWITAATGLLAASTAPAVPAAGHILEEHREAAFWAIGAFTLLVVLRHFFLRGRRWLLALAWALAISMLISAAYHGGLLVYHFGVGVLRGS